MVTPLERARELIKAKRYDEARKLLKTIDHPTARNWLETLDALSPTSGGATARPAATNRAGGMPDDVKVDLMRANDLIKQGDYEAARRVLEPMDHPKAREWLTRLDAMAPQPELVAATPVAVAAAPAQNFKLRKPLPEIEAEKPLPKFQVSGITLMIMFVVIAIVAVLAFAAMKAGGVGPISATQLTTFIPIVIMLVIVVGLRLGLGNIFASRMGFRLLLMFGSLGAFAVTSFMNTQVRIPFQDQSLSFQYPGTWVAQSLDKNEDCLDDPEWRRCLTVLINSTQGKRVWLIMKEDTFEDDTTLAQADNNHWSFLTDESGAQLDKQWDTTIGGQPAMVRQYTFTDDTTTEMYWYSTRFFVMRDSHHLIRFSFISEKPDTINALWSDIEGMYKSIQLKAV